MKLKIDDTRTIGAIQKEFTSKFPCLKVEFFKRPHATEALSPLKEMITEDMSLGQFRTKHNEGILNVNGSMTVAEFESAMQNEYGLSVQVFRHSGKVWLETSVTDSWTLDEQNKQGKFMEQEVGE